MIEIPRTKVNIYLKEYDTAGSHPCQFECENGKSYVTKHLGSDGRKRDLINEYIVSLLCIEAKILTPKIALIEIDENVFDGTENFSRGKPHGLGFGSELLENPVKDFNKYKSIKPNLRIGQETIGEQFLKIAVFDVWIRNNDRVVNNTNILVQEIKNGFRIFAIDHVAAFCQLSYDKLNLEINEVPPIEDTLFYHPYFERVRDDLGLFFDEKIEQILRNIATIPHDKIKEIIESVPAEWNLNNNEKKEIINFLLNGQNIIKEHVVSLIKALGG